MQPVATLKKKDFYRTNVYIYNPRVEWTPGMFTEQDVVATEELPFKLRGFLRLERMGGSGNLYLSVHGHEFRQIWTNRQKLIWKLPWPEEEMRIINQSVRWERRGEWIGLWDCNRGVGAVKFDDLVDVIWRLQFPVREADEVEAGERG